MTRLRMFTLGAAVVALVGTAAAALHAQGAGRARGGAPGGAAGLGPFGPGGFGARGVGLALGRLGLSDAQRDEVKAIATRHRTQARPLMQRLQGAFDAQRVAMEAVPVDEAAIRSAAQEVASVQADLAVDRAKLHSEVFAVLSAEQQEKAKQLETQGEARLKERRLRAQRAPKGQV